MPIINGAQVDFQPGQTVLQAARDAGVYIPTLCAHPDLPTFGACRLCIVKIEGMRGYPPACTTPITENMVITTADEELQSLRRNILELILSEHPHACIVCDDKELCEKYHICHTKAGRVTGCSTCPKKNACELREVVAYLSLDEVNFPAYYRNLPLERSDPFFDRDYNLCILCGRCVRVCEEIRGVGAIAFLNRSHQTRIGTAFEVSHLDGGCQFCGACVDVCPTGALSDKGTKWRPEPDTETSTTCLFCSVGCSIHAESRWNIVTATRPDENGPANKGQACVKGRFCIAPVVNHANRLRFPLIKKEGVLTPVGWDEAISFVANGLKTFSPDRIGFIASSFLTNEAAYLMQKLARTAIGSPNIDNTSPLSGPLVKALYPAIGSGSGTGAIDDIETSELILMVGADVCHTHPVLAVNLVKAKYRGATRVLIDTEPENASKVVDLHIQVDDVLSAFFSVFEHLAGRSSDIPKEFMAGIDPAADSDMTRNLAAEISAKKTTILFGDGVLDCTDPQLLITLLYNITVVSGNQSSLIPLWTEGNTQGVCYMGALPGFLPGWQPAKTEGIGNADMQNGKVKALYTTDGGAFAPESIEFLVLQDIYPSKLMESADAVLPAAAFTETNGTITSLERRILPIRACAKPPGSALSDWEIISKIAQALNATGFEFAQAEEITQEITGSGLMDKKGVRPIQKTELSVAPLESGPSVAQKARYDRYKGVVLKEVVEDLNVLYNARGVGK